MGKLTTEVLALRLESWACTAHEERSDLIEAAALLRSQAAEIASLKGGISSLRFASQPGSGGNRDGTEVEGSSDGRLWLWRNGDHWLAFDTPNPTYEGGDPRVLGEPAFTATPEKTDAQ